MWKAEGRGRPRGARGHGSRSGVPSCLASPTAVSLFAIRAARPVRAPNFARGQHVFFGRAAANDDQYRLLPTFLLVFHGYLASCCLDYKIKILYDILRGDYRIYQNSLRGFAELLIGTPSPYHPSCFGTSLPGEPARPHPTFSRGEGKRVWRRRAICCARRARRRKA